MEKIQHQSQRGRRLLPALATAVGFALFQAGVADAQQGRSDAERPYTHARALVGVGSFVGIPTRDGDLDPGPGVQVRGGFRLNRWVAAEAVGEYLIRFDGPDDTFQWGWTAGIQSRGYLAPRLGWIQPYLLGGATAIQTRRRGAGDADSELGFALRGGAGVELYTRDDFAVLLEALYVRPFLDPEGLDYVSLGFALQWN